MPVSVLVQGPGEPVRTAVPRPGGSLVLCEWHSVYRVFWSKSPAPIESRIICAFAAPQ